MWCDDLICNVVKFLKETAPVFQLKPANIVAVPVSNSQSQPSDLDNERSKVMYK